MDILSETRDYSTVRIKLDEDVCFIQIYRPEANNTINDLLIEECLQVLKLCEETIKIVVLEGLPDVFCFGADFTHIKNHIDNNSSTEEFLQEQDPEPLYNLWMQLTYGPYITIAHVRGKANAGGVGFVAACDVVLCEEKTVFSLSELLFGLMPACVLPFLIRRLGFAKANYLTVMTQPISAQLAHEWGLVDAFEHNSENLLRKHLLRLKRISKTAVARYKRYMNDLDDVIIASKPKALEVNREVFSDRNNLEKITRYVKTGRFPWE